MKKFLIGSLMVLAAVPAMAQHHGNYGHHHGHHGGWAPWIGGAVLGAVIYDAYRRPVIVQQPPVIVQQPTPVVVQQQQSGCTAWREIQSSDGTIYRERTCYGIQQ